MNSFIYSSHSLFYNMTLKLFLFLLLLVLPVAQAATIMPVDCTTGTVGTLQNEACLYGTGFEPGQEMDLYVVEDQDLYLMGGDLNDVSGHIERAQADERGLLKLWTVWEDFVGGVFDFIADINLNGRIDQGDVLNAGNPILSHTGGGNSSNGGGSNDDIEEVPEFGTLAALAVLIGASIIAYRRRSA